MLVELRPFKTCKSKNNTHLNFNLCKCVADKKHSHTKGESGKGCGVNAQIFHFYSLKILTRLKLTRHTPKSRQMMAKNVKLTCHASSCFKLISVYARLAKSAVKKVSNKDFNKSIKALILSFLSISTIISQNLRANQKTLKFQSV